MLARRLIYTTLILITTVVTFYVIGVLAPVAYEGTREVAFIDRSIDIWKNLTSLETIQQRKPEVVRVELLSEGYDAVSWREYLKNGQTRTFRVLERNAPYHFKIERFQADDGVTGTWTYDFTESNNYTILRIAESSVNQNEWLRAWHTILGRNVLLRREVKALRVSLFDRLLQTP
jgi:hypothetical protein